MCDCTKVYGNENFWNGADCQAASNYNQSCEDLTTNFQCQSLTQFTSCNMTDGNYICGCAPLQVRKKKALVIFKFYMILQYYNGTHCKNQGSYNAACSIDDHCLTILGLICTIGLKCG
jgi:hypothetical protein